MSTRREPSTPPTLPGHEFVRLLGMGGFADVFLYEQQMPRRSVAVKVLLAASLGDEVRERFRAEADMMARLSHHPSIVTIHHADVAADGRPYLVMEYCSRPGLGQRYRNERMSVAEVLRIGVRLASAVETAHRAGILHRDVKPANVLITDFGWPALTDFGIAATTLASGAATGMSIPWSPPELLAEDPRGDERSDVYSLAATVYSLLARRSPFEVPGGANSAADLIARIERSPLAPTGRGDVPEQLDAVLARAMDKDPARRHPSALGLARALQQVEAELMLPLTALDLPEDVVEAVDARTDDQGDDQATRLRPVQTVSPEGAPPAPTSHHGGVEVSAAALALHAPAVDAPVPTAVGPTAGPVVAAPGPVPAHEGGEVDGVPASWHAQVGRQPPPEVQPGPRRGARVAAVVAGVLVLGAGATAAVLAFGGDPEPTSDPTPTASVTTPTLVAVPAPADLTGAWEGDAVTFTWQNPDPQDGDRYAWGVTVAGGEPALELVDEPSVTFTPDAEAGTPVCIEVSLVREDRRASTEPAVGCTS
ncbi:serine/threonine protein kinase [Cellulomonas sp. APG4]|uniref:serine/threonine-protein kinase n=1 Tax=Cellulomonas sp. APG4 TaxID=1538656 RepID=UPI001379D6AD|nr:serine/threonine-protein kinase [Cellulomonas sp. APG4]NCT89745.1 serine/threonine protein kinase [Cellulomonas sp. APG4]